MNVGTVQVCRFSCWHSQQLLQFSGGRHCAVCLQNQHEGPISHDLHDFLDTWTGWQDPHPQTWRALGIERSTEPFAGFNWREKVIWGKGADNRQNGKRTFVTFRKSPASEDY
jgi:hypothetical protein